VFEPTHGSAPKYAGQYKVNPIAMLLTTKLMFDWLKKPKWPLVGRQHVRSPRRHGLDVAKAIADYASS